jgi:4-hydroxy-2-oxoheptanedioate aldolase
MKVNTLKQKWQRGEAALNGWLSIGNGFAAEVMAAQGFDSITIDMQHGVIDYAQCVSMLQSMTAYDVTPMVRVPWLDPGAIMKALDAGAYGIICPMINNRKEAETLVSYMRYPPHGTRSFGPTRITYSAGADYAATANEQVLCLAMIETAEAMSNLEEIVSTPGLDGVYIGPADLSIGVTNGRLAPGLDRQEDEMITNIKRILEAAKSAGINACLHCGSPEYAAQAIGWGFHLCTLGSDARLLAQAASDCVGKARELSGMTTTSTDSTTGGY